MTNRKESLSINIVSLFSKPIMPSFSSVHLPPKEPCSSLSGHLHIQTKFQCVGFDPKESAMITTTYHLYVQLNPLGIPFYHRILPSIALPPPNFAQVPHWDVRTTSCCSFCCSKDAHTCREDFRANFSEIKKQAYIRLCIQLICSTRKMSNWSSLATYLDFLKYMPQRRLQVSHKITVSCPKLPK